MKLLFEKSFLNGKISAPPSKSMAHRYIFCASMAEGISTVENISLSEDICATIDAVDSFGAKAVFSGNKLTVKGISPADFIPKSKINCRESATTLRFVLPLCLLTGREVTLCGSGVLISRPMDIYEHLCKDNGFLFCNNGNEITVKGKLCCKEYNVNGGVSSQFISGLMLALPSVTGDSVIEISGSFESRSYIDMTVSVLEKFGILIVKKSENSYYIPGNQKFIPNNSVVEGDYSNSAVFDAFNFIGMNVTVSCLNENSLQGDRIYKEIFPQIADGNPVISVENCPDIALVMISLASVCNGARFTNTHRLKYKESKRDCAIAEELRKFGADIEVCDNKIIVRKSRLHYPSSELQSHNDHRVAMALSIPLSIYGGILDGAECVNKSFPDFYNKLKDIGFSISEI